MGSSLNFTVSLVNHTACMGGYYITKVMGQRPKTVALTKIEKVAYLMESLVLTSVVFPCDASFLRFLEIFDGIRGYMNKV